MPAVIYVRISSDPKGEGLGVARQEADCRADCARRGWDILGVEVDNDVSATKGTHRPAYERALTHVREGRADALSVWSYDRLCRRILDLETVLDLVEVRKVPIGCVSGDLDLATPMGRTLARIIAAIAAGEVEQMKYRLKRKQQQLAETGAVGNGGVRPYGYAPNRVDIVAEEADVLKEMCRRVLLGESITSIAEWLNSHNHPPVRAAQWSPTAVKAVLVKPHLAGLRVYQGVIVGDGVWEPIFDRGTWEALQVILKAPARKTNSSNTRKHLLSGLITCGECGGKHMTVHKGTQYQCRTCGRVSRSARHLERFVISAALVRLNDLERSTPVDNTVVNLGRERAALEDRRHEVLSSFAELGMSSADLATVLGRITTRLSELDTELARARAPQITQGLSGLTRAEFDALPLARRRELLDVLLERIVVGRGRRGFAFDTATISITPR